MLALFIQLFKLVDELLLVVRGREPGKVETGDVVEVHRVGHVANGCPLIC
jgi:hypothetical protein